MPQPQKIRLELSAQAQKYARADAPREVRLMAARGALPLPPVELAAVLFALMHDQDAEVKTTARDSLENLPDGVLQTVLTGPSHPAVLDHLAHAFRDDEQRLEHIALNPAIDDSTMAFLAGLPFKKLVDVASNNQERLLRHPAIVDALGDNPLTGRSVIDRILNFLGMDRPRDAEVDELVDVDAVSDDAARAALEAVLGEEFRECASVLIEESETGEGVAEEELEIGGNLFNLVQKMSVFQKIKLGRMGNKEARSLLVRDRNKIVAIAAVTSPKITDNELTSIAQSRNVSDEVIRIISMNREVTRNYKVKLALATNPKCPQAAAMKFVNYLQDKDLRTLMKSKDVPTVVSTHARRILTKKGKL
jgi:hypothetical protein